MNVRMNRYSYDVIPCINIIHVGVVIEYVSCTDVQMNQNFQISNLSSGIGLYFHFKEEQNIIFPVEIVVQC